MRVMVASCWPPQGGQGIGAVATELALCLKGRGHEVFFLSPRPENREWYLDNDIAEVFSDPASHPIAGALGVLSAAEDIRPDILINNDHPFVQAAMPHLTCPTIVICHTMAWGTFALACQNHLWAEQIVALSNDMHMRLVSRGIPPSKISVIFNGLPDLRMQGPPRSNKLRVVFAGNWTKTKGADKLINALYTRIDSCQDFEFHCFGAGRSNRKLEQLKKAQWFHYHGRVSRDNFLESLGRSDILIFPSRIEGCPMTVLEALRAGVAPVVSDGDGAMKTIVTHGVNGYVARLSDWTNDMWEILDNLNQNRRLLNRIKKNARQSFLERFTIERMCDELLALTSTKRPVKFVKNNSTRSIHWHRPIASDNGSLLRRVGIKLTYRLGWIRHGPVFKT